MMGSGTVREEYLAYCKEKIPLPVQYNVQKVNNKTMKNVK
jgi:hypothetical protein